MQTILCKNIISKDLAEFKDQISPFNFVSIVSDDFLKLTQLFLLTKYGNSNIRYETAENFLNALSLRIYDIAPVFEKRYKIINDALSVANENYFKNISTSKDIYDIDTTYNITDVNKFADTPTGVKAETDFVNKYTNSMNKNENEQSGTDDRTITKDTSDTKDLLKKIDELQNLRSLMLENYANKFNDLFVMIL